MVLKVTPGSTGNSTTHWGSLWSCFGDLIPFPQRQVWKMTLETAGFSLILGFRPKLRSQKGHENAQNGLGYQVGITTDDLKAIPSPFNNFNLSAFNFLKTTGLKRYGPPPFKTKCMNCDISFTFAINTQWDGDGYDPWKEEANIFLVRSFWGNWMPIG